MAGGSTYTAVATYSGDSNNATSTSSPDSVTIGLASSTTVVVDNSPVVAGGALTFTATVSTDSGYPLSGTVSWILTGPDTPTCLSTTLTGDQATCTIADVAGGSTYTAVATYSGDSNNATSTSSPDSVTIGLASSTTVVVDNSPVVAGGALTFTATVSTDSGYPLSGTVSCESRPARQPTCLSTTLTGDQATCTIADVAGGSTYTAVATYSGDSNNATSTSSPDSVTIGLASSTTVVVDNSPVVAGGALTFTATVSTDSGYPLSGTVSWILTGPDTPTCLSTTLTGDQATCTIADVAGGSTYTAVATYSGDSNNATSTSSPDSVTIGLASSTTVVVDNSPVVAGGALTFTATVSTDSGYPLSGTVSWTSTGPDTPTCLSTTLTGDQATCTIADVAGGSTYTAVATYSGDSYNATSTSSPDSVTIGLASSTTVVVDNSPVVAGGALTFTATVSTDSGYPLSGTVSWTLTGPDTPACSSTTLTGDQATCTLADVAGGST